MSAVAPGVNVSVGADPVPSGPPTDVGRWFVAGITEKGRTDKPVRVTSYRAFTRRFGERTHFAELADPARLFFSEGGGELVVSRVVGPAASQADVTLTDGDATAPQDTLRVIARDPGPHGNDLSITIEHVGGEFTVVVLDDGEESERFAGLADPADAVDALAGSDLVRGEDLASTNADPRPAEATSALTGGDDDRAGVTQTQREAALDRFDRDLGPGQVSMPGQTSAAAHAALVAHAEQRNRVAYLDAAEDATRQQLLDAAGAVNSRQAGLFAPWVQISGEAGRQRSVPPSAFAAGLTGRRDVADPTAHVAPAGLAGQAQAAVDISGGGFTDPDDIAELNGGGVNLIRSHRIYGVQLYGFRSLSSQAAWRQLTAGRYLVGLSARLEGIAERYVFRTLAPATIADFGNALSAELKRDYQAGALFGDDPDDAYTVDVGDDVNTLEDLAEGRLAADVNVKVAPFGEVVHIRITKQTIA